MKKTILAAVASVLLAGCGGISPEEAVLRGQEALAKNDIRGASIEFKTALQGDSSTASARVGLAKIALLNRNFDASLGELEKVDRRAITDEHLLNEITTIQARALQRSEGYLPLADLDNRNIPEVIYYQVLNSLGREAVSNAKDLVPAKSDAPFIRLAQYVLSAVELKPADALAIMPIQEAGSDAYLTEYALLKSRLALGANEMETAIAALVEYSKLNPGDSSKLLQLSNILVFNEKFSDAKPYLEALLNQFPQQAMINDLWSVVNYEDGKYDIAQSASSLASISDPGAVRPRLIGAYSSIRLNEPQEALNNLEFVIDELSPSHPAQRLYIRLKASSGDFDAVIDKALAIDVLEAADAALLSNLGMDAARRGDTETAQKLADRALEANSSDATLGLLQLSLNQTELAFETLEKAFEVDPSSPVAGNSLATAYLSTERFDDAIDLANKWISEGRKVEGYMLSAIVESRRGDLSAARTLFKKTLIIEPSNLMARAGVIETLVQLDGIPAAKKQLKTWIQDDGMLPLYRNYIAAARETKDPEIKLKDAAETLADWLKEGVVSGSEATFMAGQTYFLAKEPAKARLYLAPLSSEYGDRRDYWLLISSIAEQENDDAGAEVAYTSWQRIAPKDPMPLMGLVRLAGAAGDFDLAISLMENGLQQIENDLPGKIILSQLYLKVGRLVDFRDLVGSLPADFKASSLAGKALDGVVDVMRGRYESGITKIRPFVEETVNEDFLRWLISAMERSGQSAEQKLLLKELLSKTPESSMINFMLGNLFASSSDFDKAEVHYVAIAKITQRNPMVYNNLAYVQMKLGKLDLSLLNAESAIKLSPKNPSFVDTYANVLIERGETQKAINVMESLLSEGVTVNDAFNATLQSAKSK
jgi:putative PEP-CTERM system TPR-repeat lipoprotein